MIDKSMSGKIIAEFDFPIVATKVKEFSLALKNPDPLYTDEAHAISCGYPSTVMPITFPVTFPFHIKMKDAVMDSMKLLGMNEKTSVHGEATFEYKRPVFSNESLKAVMKVGKIFEKSQNSGKTMTLVEIIYEYFDKDNEKVLIFTNLFIEKS
ncbi:MaoC family dehydratase N-terminal domain-containing protein [Aestuariicella sp. G3-2]|uniref:FAS1-like dehydratase domain-containing protein n=1 Tax=Pseudomaricurvus albidus TaxID=2842452 RepID=UPI001C0B6477|nr:MaoC family dehydratase N-terminal domain-containing protein [Aestuariicella albida]MBU3069193.1 MaoC family dehydratase N-terminal domain-containing protein [Aestuariicella albida]